MVMVAMKHANARMENAILMRLVKIKVAFVIADLKD